MPKKQKREGKWLGKRGAKFYAFWYDAEARQRRGVSLGTEDPEEAQRRLGALLVHGQDLLKSPKERAASVTVDAILEAYQRQHIEKTNVHPENGRVLMANLLGFFAGADPASIGVPECRGYADYRAEMGRAPGTIRREVAHLQAAMNFARKWRLLPAGADPVVELPRGGEPRGVWLLHDEMKRLRETADEPVRDFIDFLYYTGARRRTVTSLTAPQVDLDGFLIRLNPSGRKRTTKRRPTVPIDVNLRPALHRRLSAAGADRDRLLFPGHDKHWYRMFVSTLERAGLRELPERGARPAGACVIHTLRHTRATHLLQAGKDPWQVAGLLGDTLATIEKTYGHHCPNHLRGAVEVDTTLAELLA